MLGRLKLSSEGEFSDDFDNAFYFGFFLIGFGIFLLANKNFWGIGLILAGLLVFVLTKRFFKRYKNIEFDESFWYLISAAEEIKLTYSCIQALKPTYGMLDYGTFNRNPVRYVYKIKFLNELNQIQRIRFVLNKTEDFEKFKLLVLKASPKAEIPREYTWKEFWQMIRSGNK